MRFTDLRLAAWATHTRDDLAKVLNCERLLQNRGANLAEKPDIMVGERATV
jgi:hypothetical protein